MDAAACELCLSGVEESSADVDTLCESVYRDDLGVLTVDRPGHESLGFAGGVTPEEAAVYIFGHVVAGHRNYRQSPVAAERIGDELSAGDFDAAVQALSPTRREDVRENVSEQVEGEQKQADNDGGDKHELRMGAQLRKT